MNDEDRRLIADCLGGRRDAFGELVSRYQARLYNAALRLVNSPEDAADVVQDAFLSAYQALHSFKGDAEFFTWLYRIAFNTAISLKRKKRPSVSLDSHTRETGLDPDDPSDYVKPSAAIERTEDERQLHDAIARLSAEHRDVLVLKDLEGMKYEEIAEVLGVPIGTIRSRLHRARLELRDLLTSPEERSEAAGQGGGSTQPTKATNGRNGLHGMSGTNGTESPGSQEDKRDKEPPTQPRPLKPRD